MPRSTLLLSVLILAACGDAIGGGPELDLLPDLALTEVFRVGSVDDPDVGFSRIGSTTVDADGNVYVFENADMEIRVFSPDGEPITSFGRQGQGPGEFGRQSTIGIAGDTLWAVEPGFLGATRVSFFRRFGEHLDTRSVDGSVRVALGGGSQGIVAPVAWRRDGTLDGYMNITISGLPMEGGSDAEVGDSVRIPRVRFDLEGNVIDTIGHQIRVVTKQEEPATTQVQGQSYRLPVPPSAASYPSRLADGTLHVDRPSPATAADARIRLVRLGEAGDTIWDRTFAYEPMPFTEAVLDTIVWQAVRRAGNIIQFVDGAAQRAAPPEDPDAVFHALRGAMDFPPFPPPVRGVEVTEDGGALLQWADDGGALDRWLTVSADGEARGWFTLPRGAQMLWASADELLVMERDEFDVPWLVKYRLGT